MKPSLLVFILWSVFTSPILVAAAVQSVTVSIPEPRAWVGQRVPFFIELRARGSFAGTASFSLPQIPQTVVLKVGNPIVSSETVEGESWFVQRHEFAIFSQQSGTVAIPSFAVRFGSRDGFTGPVADTVAHTPAAALEIQRPPGSESIGFLMTTDFFDVSEIWEPEPGPSEVGAVFKRTVTQRAEQMTGMALAPISTTVPEGVRIYPGQPEINDKTERGAFLGERRETVTYLIEKPGTFTLPEMRFVFWNPREQKLEMKSLPAVTFDIAAPPVSASAHDEPPSRRYLFWLFLTVVVFVMVRRWRSLVSWAKRCWGALNPPDRVAARRLLRACRQNDAACAHRAWLCWRVTRNSVFLLDPELGAEIRSLQRHIYGPMPQPAWRGSELGRAFSSHLKFKKGICRSGRPPALPTLNPLD